MRAVTPLDVEIEREQRRAAVRGLKTGLVIALLIGLLALAVGCTPPAPPIAVQSYCEIKQTELIDMKDRNLRNLNVENKKAVLAGDDNYKRECLLGDRSKSGGPR